MEDTIISQAQFTIVDLNDGVDGVDGYTVILTNESHAIQCDFLGNPLPGEIGFASSKANSTIIVYKGEQRLSAIGLSDAMTLGKFKYSLEPKTSSSTCLGDRATNDKFYLKELYSDSGSLLINITLDNNQTVVREFTWTKAKHGEDAKYIKLRYNNVFKYPNKTSTTPTPTSIDISMDIFNIANYSIAWKYLNSSGSYVDVVSGTGCVISSDKKTLTINDKALFVNDICKIKAICTDTTYNKQYVDEAIIYKQYDGNDGNDGSNGADAYSCVLTNESDTILFDQNGTIKPGQINSTTCKASSSIMVKKGTQTLNPVSESATPGTGQYKFKFEPAPINCSVARNGDSAFYITGLTSGKDNGKVSISIYLEGNTNKIVKEYTWNKVIDGVDARFVTVEGEDKFSYDNSSDTTPTPTSIVLTATAQNIPSPTYKWQYFNGTLIDIVSGAGSLIENNKLTIDDKKLFPNGVKTAKIQCSVTYNGITYSDTKSIIKVYDGDQGQVGPPGSDSKTVIISGQNQIKYDKNNTPIPSSITLTATPNNYKSPTYKWYYVTSSGATLISGQTTNKLSVAHNSAWFASDIALIRVECRESSGSDLSSFDFSITRSYDGSDATSLTLNITGGTRNVCYNGKNNLLTTVINPFTIELYEDTTNVSSSSNVRSITWSCSGHYTIGSANVGAVNFKPTPINTYDETKLDTSVSVTVNYKGRVIKQIVPVSVSKNSTALDWVEEWDGSKVEVGGVQIISPKIFAGKKDTQTNLLTGIALGQDIINKNDNIGMAIYYNNKLLGRINADPSVDNNNILVLGALEGKQVTLNTSGEVVIGGGLKVSVGSTTTTVSDISNTANKGVSDAANAKESADTANRLAQSAQSSANSAQSSANVANNKHAELASDNKLTPSEKKSSKKEWDIIVSEKSKIEGEASRYGVSVSNYQTKYNTLNTYITPILTDLNTTSDIVGTTYRLTFKEYYDARQDVLNSITTKAKQLADSAQSSANSAQSAANSAQATANSAQSNANTANTLLSDIANDNKLTSSEKKVTKLEWDVIVNEKDKIIADATKYSQSTTDYVNKYNTLNTYVTPILSNINTTSDIVGTTFRTNFANYYSSRQDLLNAISAKSKELADNAQSSANTANSLAQSAQTAANNAQSSANTANNKHAELSNDNKLTAIEKHSTKKEWDVIVSEKPKIESEATKFGVSLTTYQTKYNDLNTYITPLLSNMSATSDIVGTTYRQKFKDYYDARQDVLNSITSKAKQLADNAQSSANNANNKADQLNTWKKDAEQKITPEAITNTVKSAVDVDGQQLFAKMADVKITAENMIATFSEVGGVNLLRNSEFKSHTNGEVDFWYPLRWDMSAGGSHSINVRPLGNQWALNNRRTLHGAVNGLPATAKGKNLTAGFDSEYFEVQPNQTYTLGCLIAAHRTKDVTIEMLCFDANGNRIMGDNHGCWIQNVFNYTGGNDRKNWKRIVHRWTPQENAAKCILRAFMGEYLGGEDSALFWIAEPVVVKGVVDPIWTVSSDENYTGIVKSDKDGVEVEMKDGEGSQGRTLLGYQGLEVFDGRGHRKAWFGNNDSAYIQNLKVDSRIENDYLVTWNGGRPTNLHVAPNSTGDGTGRDPNNKANSITGALTWIKQKFGSYSMRQDLFVYVDGGVYSEEVYIGGWIGTGTVQIIFSHLSELYGTIVVEENTCPVVLKGGKTGWDANNGCIIYAPDTAITVRNSFCKIESFRSSPNHYPNYGGTFLRLQLGARVTVNNCDIVKYWHFVHSADDASIHFGDNRGDVAYISQNPSWFKLYQLGTYRPLTDKGGIAGDWNAVVTWKDGSHFNSVWRPKDTTPPPPPTPTYQWLERTFGLYSLRTVPEGSGSGTTARNGEWGQGKWGTYKPHRGYADIGNDPSNWCGGGDNYRNVNAWITLTRLGTSHGVSGATPRPRFKEPNGNFWDCGVGFARGDTKTIQLPSSIANAIANGSMRTLEMWAGTSTNDYSFYNNTSIKIKCEKKV